MADSISMPARHSWIISPGSDVLLLIGSALWVSGAFVVAETLGFAHGLAIFVMYVMATGHHLPGFLRIYTDPELFQYYQWRFVLVPPLVAGLAWTLAVFDLNALTVVTFIWGLWHGIMQVYGFARIYDAKQGEISSLTGWLDWLLCVSWFLLLSFDSTFFADEFRTRTASAGSSFLAELAMAPTVFNALTVTTVAITAAHIGYTLWAWGHGRRVSLLKFALLASSIGLFCVSYRLFKQDKLVSLATWEAFHDIQYYAIVWAYSRRSRDKRQLSLVGRVVFQPGIIYLLLYLGLIVVYGGLDFGSRAFVDSATGESVRPILVASAFLHFYFDGFIWKIRRANVRQDLGINLPSGKLQTRHEPDSGHVNERFRLGLADVIKQVSLLSVPIVVLLILEIDHSTWERPASEMTVALSPKSAAAHRNLARLYERDGQWDDAIREYQMAVEIEPASWNSQFRLGAIFTQIGQLDTAKRYFQAAILAGSTSEEVEFNLAVVEWQQRRFREAIKLLRDAIDKFPNSPRLLTTLATFLCTCPEEDLRDPKLALKFAQSALLVSDETHKPEIYDGIAAAYALQGNYQAAVEEIDKGIALAQKQHNSRREGAMVRMRNLYQRQMN